MDDHNNNNSGNEDESNIDQDAFGISSEDLVDAFSDSKDKTQLPFSTQDYDTCLQVLSLVADQPQLLNDPRLKELRLTGSRIFTPELFANNKQNRFQRKELAILEAKRREQTKKDRDKNHLQKAQLRQKRIDALNKLLEPPQHLLLESGESSSQKLLQDTSKDNNNQTTTTNKGLNLEDDELYNYRSCYICKIKYFKLHFFYDLLCPDCAALCYQKREQTCDLNGHVAIVTGGRLKIGYEAAIKLLQCGCEVIVTTRFPKDGIDRFAKHPDFEKFKDRLHVYGLDLRDTRSIEKFVHAVYSNFKYLDILIHNAAQTVRKPPIFYSHLIPKEIQETAPEHQPLLKLFDSAYKIEDKPQPHIEYVSNENATAVASPRSEISSELNISPSNIGAVKWNNTVIDVNHPNRSSLLSQVPLVDGDDKHDTRYFPRGKFDEHSQPLDLRDVNSWTNRLHEVPVIELFEVFSINAFAPFILNSKLKNLFLASPNKDKFIVNVSAMEGKFYRYKTSNHPHTNMAKAALNMLTRTSAADYAQDRIWMNSVDTGWVTDENPFESAQKYSKETGFMAPLDEKEGAARILDPVIHTVLTGETVFGKFLKDYRETEW